jgi:UPF0755 protein
MPLKKSTRLLLRFFGLLLLVAGGAFAYFTFFKPNVYLDGKKYKFIYIPTKATYEDLVEILDEENILQNRESFSWMAGAMDLPDNFRPGKYRVIAGMTNRQLINLLKSGKQEPVRITFNAMDRTNEDLTRKISEKLEISEDELEAFFEDETEISRRYRLNEETLRTFFIPETYELKWNTSQPELMQLLEKTYNRFWTAGRRQKAQAAGLSPAEVYILASIVQSECATIESEQRRIAGVYINRLAKNMPLQADPTVIFAMGDFSKQRVWEKDLDYDSPYNTYRNRGLPPGPISLVYTRVLDAVLNYEKHKFLYFCAKPSLNGCSDFSCTYEQHLRYRDAYRKEMDKRGIK